MAVTRDPDLHLIVDGVPVRSQQVVGGLYRFRIRPAATRVVLASRSIIPKDAGADDPRRLGVPVHRIVLRAGGAPIEMGPDHPGLTEGFHDNEGSHRWTNGRAVLPMELFQNFTSEISIEVHVGSIDLEYPAE